MQADRKRMLKAGVTLEQVMSATSDALDTGLLPYSQGHFIGRGGFIDAYGPRCSDDREDLGRSLHRSEIEAALHGCGPVMSYGMTSRGGARWEAVAKPDWSRFLDESAGLDPDEVEVAGLDRDRVASHIRRYTRFAVVPGSERWETLIPWQATYWKTIPRGYRVTVGWPREAPTKAPDWDGYERWIQWYNNPFKA